MLTTLGRHRIITTIDDLTEDLLIQVFNKLPPRNMGRALLVCKTWHRLITTVCIPTITSSPPHALLYSTLYPCHETSTWHVACFTPPSQDRRLTPLTDLCHFLPFTPSYSEFLDCVNGFLLFFQRSTKYFYLCNPAIEHYAAFPNPAFPNDPPGGHLCSSAALVFDPLCKVAYICPDTRFKLRVFTIRQALMKEYEFVWEHPYGTDLLKRFVFSDGSLYALSADGYLMRFGIIRISVQAIELPNIVAKKHPIGGIAVSQGRLHYTWEDGSTMMVWMLGQDDRIHDWVFKYNIPYQYFVDHPLCSTVEPIPDQSWYGVYTFDPASDVLYIGNVNEIYRYDPCTKKVDRVCKMDRMLRIFGWTYYVYSYTVNLSTLYSVCIGDE